MISEEQRDYLIARDGRNAEVIQQYITGKELNRRPDCSGTRWIINFRNWTLERAEEYPDCVDIVRRLVKPFREGNKDRQRREIWWRFTRPTSELYRAITHQDHTLVVAQTSNTVMPVRIPSHPVFDQTCIVFTRGDFSSLAMLSSNVHLTWVMRYTTPMRTDLRYLPSSVFVTLPLPDLNPGLEALGQHLDMFRRDLMQSRAWGLTRTYNQVHDPDNHDQAIQELRDIHVAIDEAVMRAYGWDDLDLKIGHHPTKIGIRWTVSKEARFELLDRLLEENHRRYALENPS